MSNAKKEMDDCPPGMHEVDGKCVAEERMRKEEDNAGDTSSKGEPTLTDASTKPNPYRS